MAKTTFVTVNGEKYAQAMAEKKQAEYGSAAKVSVEKGSIPGWGGGYSEPGYRIIVETSKKK